MAEKIIIIIVIIIIIICSSFKKIPELAGIIFRNAVV